MTPSTQSSPAPIAGCPARRSPSVLRCARSRPQTQQKPAGSSPSEPVQSGSRWGSRSNRRAREIARAMVRSATSALALKTSGVQAACAALVIRWVALALNGARSFDFGRTLNGHQINARKVALKNRAPLAVANVLNARKFKYLSVNVCKVFEVRHVRLPFWPGTIALVTVYVGRIALSVNSYFESNPTINAEDGK
jgi:hypothetical protein